MRSSGKDESSSSSSTPIDVEINKWNHDSTTNILEIQLNKKCTQNREYKLNLFISYKNYGSLLYDKSLNQQIQS
jgi:hypothetical protein